MQIACFRSLGLPSRYISGYINTVLLPGQPLAVKRQRSNGKFEAATFDVILGRE